MSRENYHVLSTSIIADKKVRNIVPGNINVGTSYRREAPKPRRFIVMICGSVRCNCDLSKERSAIFVCITFA